MPICTQGLLGEYLKIQNERSMKIYYRAHFIRQFHAQRPAIFLEGFLKQLEDRSELIILCISPNNL